MNSLLEIIARQKIKLISFTFYLSVYIQLAYKCGKGLCLLPTSWYLFFSMKIFVPLLQLYKKDSEEGD